MTSHHHFSVVKMHTEALHFSRIYADETHAVDGEGADSKTAAPRLPLQPGALAKKDVLEHYSSVFQPGRGKPLGSPLHIEMDSDVTPVHVPRRRVPVAKLHRVNDELKRLCDDGIIRPVKKPTEWPSNILVKEKPNGKLRICIDPSQTINRAIKRPTYTIPTIEEKLPLLTKAKVFTIMDVSEAFHTSVLPPSYHHLPGTKQALLLHTHAIPYLLGTRRIPASTVRVLGWPSGYH